MKNKLTTYALTLLVVSLVLFFWNPASIKTSRDDKDRTLKLTANGSASTVQVRVSVRSSIRGMLIQTDRTEDAPWVYTVKVLPGETIAAAMEVWTEAEKGWSSCRIMDSTKSGDHDWAQVKFPSLVAYAACSHVAH